MKRALFGATIVIGLLAAVGCGASNRASLPEVTAAKTPQRVTFVLKIPKRSAASSAKRAPAYVSANTKSVSFAISADGGATYGSAQIIAIDTSDSSQCTDGGNTYNCSVDFDATPGSLTILVKTYDTADDSGHVLSEVVAPETVIEGQDNPFTFTLDGVIAKFVVAVDPTSVTIGTGGTVTATWNGQDASGATIVAPGDYVDDTDAAVAAPTLTIGDAPSAFTNQTYDSTTRTWTVTYDGSSIADQTFTVSENAGNSGIADGSATLTVSPAATPSASPTPTAAPTATPTTNAIVNGDFETSSTSIAPWFVCYVPSQVYSVVDASPEPQSTALPTAGATSAPTAHPSPDDVTIEQSVPEGNAGGTASVHGGGNAVLIGRNAQPLGRGTSGVCQTVTVPSSNPELTFWLYEGGDTYNTSHQIHLGMVFANSATFSPISSFTPLAGGTAYTTADLPDIILFAQDNCYNSHPGASGDLGGCAVTATSTALGGQWYEKGPYDLSGYAGQQVTLFLGKWGGASTSTLYDYVFYDDVVLSGS